MIDIHNIDYYNINYDRLYEFRKQIIKSDWMKLLPNIIERDMNNITLIDSSYLFEKTLRETLEKRYVN